MSMKSKLSPVLFLGAALTLGACDSKASSGGGAAGAPPSVAQNTTAPATSPTSATAASGTTSAPAATQATKSPTKPPTKTPSSGGDADSDSYAWSHPCAIEQLTVTVTAAPGDSSQRIIAVRNNGSASCGLSYYPGVYLDSSHGTGGQVVKPMVPGGLGGPPALPVHAHQTSYAAIGLDPGGVTSGGAAVDRINVLVDGDHMPNAATLDFPLGAGAVVLKPKLGLYERSVEDAVASMLGANTQL